MQFVFYDSETTGTETSFDQILQFAAVRTNDALEIECPDTDTLNIRCRRLPHNIPSPGALMVTHTAVEALDHAEFSHYEMMRTISTKLANWSPATFIGYNSISFDERLLRQGFYQTLLPLYLTNTNGCRRADLMQMVQAAAVYTPEKLRIPKSENRLVFKLGEVVRANGITFGESEAHDALQDVYATIALARLLRTVAPAIWDTMLMAAHKTEVQRFMEGSEVFYVTNFFYGKVYTEVVTVAGRNPENDSEIAVFNLGQAPDSYLGLDVDELVVVLGQSPKVIRTVKANSQPTVMPFTAKPAGGTKSGQLEEEIYRRRARAIRQDNNFQDRVSQALIKKRSLAEVEPSPYVEGRIYDAFSSAEDEALKREFHRVPWSARLGICRQFSDQRLVELGRRLIYFEHPEVLTRGELEGMNQWLAEHILTDGDVPWTTIPKALIEVGDLKRTASRDVLPQLREIERYLEGLAEAHTASAAVRA